MATSKPEFQNIILSNGTSYCGLYKRRVVNTSGVAATQYYWFPTNKSGDITNWRDNILNGTFSSASLANSYLPSGYSTYADNWANEKYMSYMYNFPSDSAGVQAFKDSVDAFVALGANNIVIPIFWSGVFPTYAAQTTNADASWANDDVFINYAKSKGVKVSLMPHLNLSATYIPSFWGSANNEKDVFGNYVSVGGYQNGHPSLAGSGANMMKDFYQKVCARYSSILGAQLGNIMPVFTEQSEYGFNYENTVGGVTAKALYGYSADSIAGFQAWLQSNDNPDKYANIGALNSAWGTSFANFAAVTAPTTGYSFGATEYQLSEIFASNQGKDFYLYLEYQLAKFAGDLRTITTTYATGAKFVLAFGSVAPNDPLTGLRGAYNVLKWATVSDGLKSSNIGVDNRNSTSSLTLDYIQNYTGKKMTELHHIDYYSNGTLSVSAVKANMIASGESAIKNGVKDLMFCGMLKHGVWFDMLKEIFADLKPKMAQNLDSSRVTSGSVQVTLGELLGSAGGVLGLSKWQSAGGSNDKRINYTFLSTVERSTNNFPYSMSLFPIQTYYMKQLDVKNSYYGFRKLVDDRPYTTLQQEYNARRVPFLVPAFGITYSSGSKTYSTIEIIDDAGVVWVKVVQTAGVNPMEGNVNYGNNHPEYRYLENITEDCRFWLPFKDGSGNPTTAYYDIKITVFGASCSFEVYHADIGASNRVNYSSIVSAGATNTYRLLQANMEQDSSEKKVIKLNCNKYS